MLPGREPFSCGGGSGAANRCTMSAPTDNGAAIAGYRVLRLIGQGALGRVYLAVHVASAQPVALKITPLLGNEAGNEAVSEAGNEADADARSSFLRAAEAARHLVHPGIVAVLDAGIQGRQTWLAMELVPGGNLERHTAAPRLLPEPLALRVAERLAGALAHAHARGVVHRDLKPANVLVHWPGDIVKLADFGLARTEDGQATRTGVVPGSPAYMAPEQLAGAVPGAHTDFYALGVTLFQLLAGRLPHQGATMGDLLRQVASGTAADLRALRPDLPAELAALVARLLSRTAAERAFSGTTLAEELRAIRRRMPGPQPDPASGAMSR